MTNLANLGSFEGCWGGGGRGGGGRGAVASGEAFVTVVVTVGVAVAVAVSPSVSAALASLTNLSISWSVNIPSNFIFCLNTDSGNNFFIIRNLENLGSLAAFEPEDAALLEPADG